MLSIRNTEVSTKLFSKIFPPWDKLRDYLGGLSFLFEQTTAGKAVNA